MATFKYHNCLNTTVNNVNNMADYFATENKQFYNPFRADKTGVKIKIFNANKSWSIK